MKKLLINIGLALVLGLANVMADTITFSIPSAATGTTVATNLLNQGPMKILNITVSAQTNAALRFFDSPYITNTINVGAFTNVTKSLGVVSNTYVSPFGVTYTNFYTNVTLLTTNSIIAATQTRETILNASFVSNTLSLITFGAGRYVQGGLLVTNNPIPTLTPVIVTVEFEKIEP